MSSQYLAAEYPTRSKRNYYSSEVERHVCTMDCDIFWFNCILRVFIVMVKHYFITQWRQKCIIYITTGSLYPPQFKHKFGHDYKVYILITSTAILNSNMLTYQWFDPQKPLANSSAAAGPRRQNLTKGFLSLDKNWERDCSLNTLKGRRGTSQK